MFDICLLGCGGTMPTPYRYLTSMLASYNGKMLLIDCGEGTQVSLKMVGWGFKAIDTICFTHFHADHIAGLPGLLLTIGNSGRTEAINLVGPVGLKSIVQGLTVIAPNLPFDINIIELSVEEESTIVIGDYIIHAISAEHTISCLAYSIEILRGRKFDKDRALQQNIPMKLWGRLQKGETVELENNLYTPDMVLGEARRGLKVSYCTDSRPANRLEEFIKNSDLFICEGMYGEDSEIEKAEENKHMLFSEAASLAKAGYVKELWLTHYSPSLVAPEEYIDVVKNIFDNSLLGYDRMCKELFYEDA